MKDEIINCCGVCFRDTKQRRHAHRQQHPACPLPLQKTGRQLLGSPHRREMNRMRV